MHDDGSYDVEYDDGDLAEAVLESLIFEDVAHPLNTRDTNRRRFRVGDRVDAKWPADVLQNTELKDIFWPGVVQADEDVINEANPSGTVLYTILFDDGEVS